jgi:ABC-type multidrug transport system permease subunit
MPVTITCVRIFQLIGFHQIFITTTSKLGKFLSIWFQMIFALNIAIAAVILVHFLTTCEFTNWRDHIMGYILFTSIFTIGIAAMVLNFVHRHEDEKI